MSSTLLNVISGKEHAQKKEKESIVHLQKIEMSLVNGWRGGNNTRLYCWFNFCEILACSEPTGLTKLW